MRRTFFDYVILVVIILLILVCIGLAGYTTYGTRRALIEEKQNNLINEAELLSEQSISSYLRGITSLEYLQIRFDEFEDALKAKVWFYSEDGRLIIASMKDQVYTIPQNIHQLDPTINLNTGFTLTGDFYGMFEGIMISIGIPVYVGKELSGYLILHTSMSELDRLQGDMLSVLYMPFVVILLLFGLVLAYLSKMVLRPIARINETAREYAKGNFEARTGVTSKDEIGQLAESLEYMAGELNKMEEYRKNFIANISHDFRSPLTSIKGYLEAMLDGTIPQEKYERYLRIVLNESARLAKLTSGLLELNEFDNHKLILNRQNFDIVDVIRSTRNTVEGQCEAKNLDFRINCPAENTTVYADKMKIGQVVYNLVDNAIKFSPEGGQIQVTVSEKMDQLFVSVKDEGPGIEKDKQNKVWVRFYKMDSSRGKDKKGTGLGLSITKEIIRAHGEHINLISEEGKGSEFIFSLSREKKEEEQATAPVGN